jgi:hypothetical protein
VKDRVRRRDTAPGCFALRLFRLQAATVFSSPRHFQGRGELQPRWVGAPRRGIAAGRSQRLPAGAKARYGPALVRQESAGRPGSRVIARRCDAEPSAESIASFLTESGVAAVRMMSPCGARRARHMPPHLLELAGPGEAVQEFAVDVADLQLHFVWEPMAAVEVPPRRVWRWRRPQGR